MGRIGPVMGGVGPLDPREAVRLAMRDEIRDPAALDRADRLERRAELRKLGGLRWVHEVRARAEAVRGLKRAHGESIPPDVLDRAIEPDDSARNRARLRRNRP